MIRISKLYFRYGTMGSSKTANALMTRFNYLEKGYDVILMKPSIDNRDGTDIIKSRIGLSAEAATFNNDTDLATLFIRFKNRCKNKNKVVVIVDEVQFATSQQIDQLKYVSTEHCNVLTFGLRTNFKTQLFAGSKRLFELADSISEIKSVCHCGNKAIINARIDGNGNVVKDGEEIEIGGNERYIGLCYSCWSKEGAYIHK